MFFSKIISYLRLLIILSILVAAESKKKKNKRREEKEDHFQFSSANICDIDQPIIIYCYCNTVEVNEAHDGNCWIFNDTSDDQFSDVWESFASQSKMKHLTLHLRPDGTLKKIPTVAVAFLPDLERFEVQYGTITTVHAHSFANSTSIEMISLTRNSISLLDPHSFSNLPSLKTIRLGINHLTDVNRTVFTNLPQLKQLYMDTNNISSIEDFAFQELSTLEELELFSNEIKVVVPETFKGLHSLTRLDLHKNRIEVLGDLTFEELKSLTYLNLMGNSIKFIASKALYGLTKLQKLNLQDNKLLSLGSDLFKYTEDLIHLDLRQNVLETLSEETVEPLLKNLRNESMTLFVKDNMFRCDTRLMWIFKLYNHTKSHHVRSSLEEVFCYMETGALPARLQEVDPTPLYEMTTMGIGPRTALLKLRPSELPDPLVRTPATVTQEEQCEHGKEGHSKKRMHEGRGRQRGNNQRRGGRGGRRRGGGQHQSQLEEVDEVTPSTALNDMVPVEPSVEDKLREKELILNRERMRNREQQPQEGEEILPEQPKRHMHQEHVAEEQQQQPDPRRNRHQDVQPAAPVQERGGACTLHSTTHVVSAIVLVSIVMSL